MKTKILLFLLVATYPTLAFSGNTSKLPDEQILIGSCNITPQIWELKSVPKIRKSNNLRRNTGSSEFAEGEFITLQGRVVDENCVPVSNAVVEIWQANAEGIYQFEEGNYDKIDHNFHSTGTSITNNLGYYSFLSIFPGNNAKRRAPHINFRIRHVDFLPLETEMFFEAQALNEKDSLLTSQVSKKHLPFLIAKGEPVNSNDINEGIKYTFDITLEGKNRYKKY